MQPGRWRSLAIWLGRKADWVSGAIAFVLTLCVSLASGAVRDGGREVLFVNAGVSIAVLAAVLAILTIMVAFLGEEFTAVLEQTDEGTKGALLPYVIVAVVAAASTVIAVLGAFVYPAALSHFQAVLLASSIGVLVAAIAGTVQVIEITAFLGTQRASLLHGMRQAEATRKKRLREPA